MWASITIWRKKCIFNKETTKQLSKKLNSSTTSTSFRNHYPLGSILNVSNAEFNRCLLDDPVTGTFGMPLAITLGSPSSHVTLSNVVLATRPNVFGSYLTYVVEGGYHSSANVTTVGRILDFGFRIFVGRPVLPAPRRFQGCFFPFVTMDAVCQARVGHRICLLICVGDFSMHSGLLSATLMHSFAMAMKYHWWYIKPLLVSGSLQIWQSYSPF